MATEVKRITIKNPNGGIIIGYDIAKVSDIPRLGDTPSILIGDRWTSFRVIKVVPKIPTDGNTDIFVIPA